jgi:hypothetical protein
MINAMVWKAGFALAALFSFGAASGFVVGRRTVPPPPLEHVEHLVSVPAITNKASLAIRTEQQTKRWRENRLTIYRRVAKPTPEQEAAIQRHFESFAQECARIQADTRREVARSVTQLNRAIAAELTPAQRQAFQDYLHKADRRALEAQAQQ